MGGAADRDDGGDASRGARTVVARTAAAGRRGLSRLRAAAFRIVIGAVTAAAAWVVAQQLLGVAAPVFAPIAAIVALTDEPGKRGRRAVRLLGGVVVGVVVGEIARTFVSSGWLQIAIALAVGMVIVAVASINPLTLLQAGIAALIVVGTSSAQTGWTRLFSALVGGVLALVVSQVLASPSPRKLFARSVADALGPVVHGLEQVAQALRDRSAPCAREATEGLRDGHSRLAGFLDDRASIASIASATLRGRRERADVAAMQRRFGGLEYVYAGSVLLSRTATEVIEAGEDVPEHLLVGVADLAASVRAVADAPRSADPHTDRGRHGNGRRGAHEVADELARTDPDDHTAGSARLATQLHLLAGDIADLTESAGSRPADVSAMGHR